MDYAVKNDVSLSTIRRYIKSNKIHYRMEQGKYFLLDEAPPAGIFAHGAAASASSTRLEGRVEALEHRLNEALEQINELKMLVAIYEEKLTDQ
jgi:hypothetical protein